MDNDLISKLEATKKELLDKVAQIDFTINTVRGMSSFSTHTGHSVNENSVSTNTSIDKYKAYDKKALLKVKAAFIIKTEAKFLHIRQIGEIMSKLEPGKEAAEYIVKLYPALGDLKKSGAIIKFSLGSANVNSFWGSPKWLDDNGQIKKEFMYDESQVKNFGLNEIIEI